MGVSKHRKNGRIYAGPFCRGFDTLTILLYKKVQYMKNKRQEGSEYEAYAAAWLESRGYRILQKNYRTRLGEIDLIAEESGYYCFIEVKYRSSETCGSGFDAVDRRKQSVICKVAKAWLWEQKLDEWTPCRFDVIYLSGSPGQDIEAELLQNAFEYRK